MNKNLFKQLCLNYNRTADVELYKLWEYNLRCYDEDEMQKAINIIISSDKYFPNLNRVLEVVKEVVSKEDLVFDEEYKRNKMKRLGIKPVWLDKDIKNQELDEETIKESEEFNKFIKDFRG